MTQPAGSFARRALPGGRPMDRMLPAMLLLLRAEEACRHPRQASSTALRHAEPDGRAARRPDYSLRHCCGPVARLCGKPRRADQAATCALAPTGANYRVSPGSWPDFAQIADSFRLAITRSCWASGRRSAVSARRFQRDANAWACSTDGGAAGLSHPDWGPRCGRSAARCGRGWTKSWTAGWWVVLDGLRSSVASGRAGVVGRAEASMDVVVDHADVLHERVHARGPHEAVPLRRQLLRERRRLRGRLGQIREGPRCPLAGDLAGLRERHEARRRG